MMEIKASIDKLAIRNGLISALGLLAYFFIMKLVGLVHIVELRVFNVFILGFGIWTAINTYIKQSDNEEIYLRTLALGVYTSFVALIPFAIFVFFYMSWDVEFMNMVSENEWFGQYMNPYIVAFLIFFEGTISGFFIAFTLMQYMKKKEN